MYCVLKNITVERSKPVNIFVFGDVQEHSTGFSEEYFEAFKQDFLTSPNAYAIGLGDYGDFTRPSIVKRINSVIDPTFDGDYRDELDRIIDLDVERLYKKFEFLKNRTLGLTSGHHEWVYKSGENSTQRLARMLNADYLGWNGYILLKIAFKAARSLVRYAIKIFCTHGSGGSIFTSTDLGNLERKIAPYWYADIYLRGHSSKGSLSPLEWNDVIGIDSAKLVKKTRWIINCPGMMNGYVEKHTSYVELKNLPPASLGYVKIEIKQTAKDTERKIKDRVSGVTIQPYIVSPYVYANSERN